MPMQRPAVRRRLRSVPASTSVEFMDTRTRHPGLAPDLDPQLGSSLAVRLTAGLAVLLAACSGSDTTGPPLDDRPCRLAVAECLGRLEVAPERRLRHYRTHDLDRGADGVTHAIVIVHGASRNASFNFNTGLQATPGDLAESVVVVAPWFITTEEGPEPDEPYWSSGGWKRGHLSVAGGSVPSVGARVSSYAALDRIVERLSDPDRFPDMTEIVVAGHSAGGQVTHRYAAGGREPLGVPLTYVVANPSTWLFLGPERPDGSGGWAVPAPDACPDYQEWHYGLQDLNSYMSRLPETHIVQRLVSRDVRVLLGDRDTGSAQLDVSCGANLQGPHRYARGLALLDYMDAFHPGHRHVGVVVPGVAHSSRGVFLSEAGLAILLP